MSNYDGDNPDEQWVDDADEDSETELLVCPQCGKSVYEETQQCPHCGDWIVPTYKNAHTKRGWLIAIVLLLVFAILMVYVL